MANVKFDSAGRVKARKVWKKLVGVWQLVGWATLVDGVGGVVGISGVVGRGGGGGGRPGEAVVRWKLLRRRRMVVLRWVRMVVVVER